MVRPSWNFVTMKIFRNGLCISWIPTWKLSIALWIPPSPLLCTKELIQPDFNYLCVPTTWCHVAHLLPSNNIHVMLNFFLFYIWTTCQQLHILFYNNSQILFQKILKTQQISYTLTKSCCTEEIMPDQSVRLGLRVLCKRATWVVPLYLARLSRAD
jgi:hypothetical protein